MADQLGFDEATAKRLAAMYETPDVGRRRSLAVAALDAKPGDRVLDVGCGPGFFVSDLLPIVGSSGAVVGMDSSQPMLAMARSRCTEPNADFREGEATALPFGDAEFDAALSVQVMEYVADIPLALRELYRVVKPGGRVVIWDSDWSTVSWHSSDEARMHEVLTDWDAHLRHPWLPRTLGAQLRDAGWVDVEADAHNFTNTELSPSAISYSLMGLIIDFVAPRLGTEIVDAWAADLRRLGERGEYFFSYTAFCFAARKPRT
ncbi:MAG TPA: methyltransferase domain-containing protein [Mycobacteriales bacterium]|nr:methyltransferase domain-containing protein [Mycobacteriales bacterium]